jgi:hypothetical protein
MVPYLALCFFEKVNLGSLMFCCFYKIRLFVMKTTVLLLLILFWLPSLANAQVVMLKAKLLAKQATFERQARALVSRQLRKGLPRASRAHCDSLAQTYRYHLAYAITYPKRRRIDTVDWARNFADPAFKRQRLVQVWATGANGQLEHYLYRVGGPWRAGFDRYRNIPHFNSHRFAVVQKIGPEVVFEVANIGFQWCDIYIINDNLWVSPAELHHANNPQLVTLQQFFETQKGKPGWEWWAILR